MELPTKEELYNALEVSLLKETAKLIEEQKKKTTRILEEFADDYPGLCEMMQCAYRSIIKNLYMDCIEVHFELGDRGWHLLYPSMHAVLTKWFPTSYFELISINADYYNYYRIKIVISDADKLASSDAIKKYKERLDTADEIKQQIELLKRKREELMK
jgi:hypothetical protein